MSTVDYCFPYRNVKHWQLERSLRLRSIFRQATTRHLVHWTVRDMKLLLNTRCRNEIVTQNAIFLMYHAGGKLNCAPTWSQPILNGVFKPSHASLVQWVSMVTQTRHPASPGWILSRIGRLQSVERYFGLAWIGVMCRRTERKNKISSFSKKHGLTPFSLHYG